MFPEWTATPTAGIEASLTPSLVPTNTPENTNTPEPEPTIVPPITSQSFAPIATKRQPLRQGPEISLDEGGFSFKPIIGFKNTYLPGQATLTSQDGDTIISMIGAPFSSSSDIEEILSNFLETLSETFQSFDAAPPYSYTIDESNGLAANVTGELSGTPILGLVIVAIPSDEQLFYALGISADEPNGYGWEPEGRQAFEAVVDSIEFFTPIIDQE